MNKIITLKNRIKIIAVVSVLCFSNSLFSQTTLYSTNYDNGGSAPSGWTANGGTTAYTFNTTSNSGGGYTGASGSYNANNGSITPALASLIYNGSLSTIGYTSITLSWGARMTGSGATPTFYWSTDGTTWNALGFTDVTSNSTWGIVTVTLPSGAEGATNLQFKWTSGSSASTYRMDDFFVKGTVASGYSTNWLNTGNLGTSPSANFLGTINNVGLKMKTNNTTAINILADGKVAIGDFTPTEKLDVAGNGKFSGSLTANSLTLTGTGTSLTTTQIHATSGLEVGNSIHIDGITNTNATDNIFTDDDALYIQSSSTNAYNTLINANNTGSVGIGTDQPTAGSKLHLHDADPHNTNEFDGGPEGIGAYMQSHAKTVFSMTNSVSALDKGFRITLAEQPNGGGNLAAIENLEGNITIRSKDRINFYTASLTDANTSAALMADVDGSFYVNQGGVGIGIAGQSILTGVKLQVEGNTYLNGNVGIGTSCAPYKLTVDGTVGAKEVVVQTTAWCDYVFDEDYHLISLSELEKFLIKEHHLPNIPSAEVVLKDGLAIKDIITRQQKTIEELTLYIIQMEKRIKLIEEKN